MTAEKRSSPRHSVYFWAGLTFASFGAVAVLAMSDAINPATAMILMIVPAVLLFLTMRAVNTRASAGGACGKGEAQRRYIKRCMFSTSLYLLAFAVLTFMSDAYELSTSVHFILAILPGLAVIGLFWAIGRLIVEEQDEFIRMLTIRQSLIATGLALSAASIWGFLESAGLAPGIEAYWWAIVWFFGIGVGAVANRIQYGAWGVV